MLAAVVMATVPEPWINLIAVEMMNGRTTIGTAVPARPSAIYVPSPLSLIIWPSAPPPPVTSMMMPAEAIPLSISLIASSLVKFLPSVTIATTSPKPTATMGDPRNWKICINPAVFPSALDTVLIRMRIIGRTSGANDSSVDGRLLKSVVKSLE